MTSDAQYGSIKFYVNPGHFDLSFTKPGYTFEPIFDMQVPADTVTLGTMATQNANAVAITGGTAALTYLVTSPGANQSGLTVNDPTAGNPGYGLTTNVSAGTSRLNIRALGSAPNHFAGAVGIGVAVPDQPLHVQGNAFISAALGINVTPVGHCISLSYNRSGGLHGLFIQPNADSGSGTAVSFVNAANTVGVGSITTTGTTTAYNTTSDGRLKDAVATLSGALETIRALRPVSFVWKTDGTPGVGFVAQEVQAVVPQAVTGSADDPQPSMQMDASKLVPYLIGACQELAAQVQTLTARLAVLEGA